ncbi:hypothetical protein OH77DRAFT_1525923 [Trametes cingulata]|nr:hypothetical protein OH77DRAFT_1525923 [Trametes cingulata]
MPNAPQPTLPSRKSLKSNSLSKSKLSRLPRADFRQADYGVSPNVTFAEPPVVQNVEATPSGTAPAAPLNTPRRRSEEDWEAARLKPDAYYSDADSAASGDIPDAAPGAAPDAGLSPDSDAAAAAPAPPVPAAAPVSPPVKLKSLQNTKPGDLPVTPDLSTPGRAADAKQLGVQSHDLQLSTDPAMPNRADPSLNMSNPYVAAEEARRHRAGVVNIDSNRPGFPPPSPASLADAPGDLPANVTAANGTVAAVNGGTTKSEKKEADVGQLDKAAKNATAVA